MPSRRLTRCVSKKPRSKLRGIEGQEARCLNGVGSCAIFDAPLRCTIDNVAHEVRRYIHLFVASELASDDKGLSL